MVGGERQRAKVGMGVCTSKSMAEERRIEAEHCCSCYEAKLRSRDLAEVRASC